MQSISSSLIEISVTYLHLHLRLIQLLILQLLPVVSNPVDLWLSAIFWFAYGNVLLAFWTLALVFVNT
jgi:hypothetical protein